MHAYSGVWRALEDNHNDSIELAVRVVSPPHGELVDTT